jgi:hypothetical protein
MIRPELLSLAFSQKTLPCERNSFEETEKLKSLKNFCPAFENIQSYITTPHFLHEPIKLECLPLGSLYILV